MKHALLVFLLSIIVGCGSIDLDTDSHSGNDLFVDPTGEIFSNAYKTLDEALWQSVTGDRIYIAKGIYINQFTEDAPVLVMKHGVNIYGGYGGETVLDGQGKGLHVVVGTSNAILSNVTITGGKARTEYPQYNGGGMLNNNVKNLVIEFCTFIDNKTNKRGGGVYNNRSSVHFIDCTFIGNKAIVRGGGLCCSRSNVIIENCEFIENEVTQDELGGKYKGSGGAIHIWYHSSIVLISPIFQGNKAPYFPDLFYDDTSKVIYK